MLLNRTLNEKKIDPRIKRTRQLLKQAFLELMQVKSFESITVQDIAERATVNRVTFYAHFQDKYGLLEYTIRDQFLQKLHSQLPEGSPFSPENLMRLIRAVCEFVNEINYHCPPPYGQLEPLMEKQIKAELYDILRAWVTETSSPNVNRLPTAEQVAMMTSWAIYGAVVQWRQQDRPELTDEFVQQVIPLILSNLQLADKLPTI